MLLQEWFDGDRKVRQVEYYHKNGSMVISRAAHGIESSNLEMTSG